MAARRSRASTPATSTCVKKQANGITFADAVFKDDLAGTDHTELSTPPDGQSSHTRTYLRDLTSLKRDCALKNDIIPHENLHGPTNRMTGGSTCRSLQTTEAGAMGEGWLDAFAERTTHTNSTVPDFIMGAYMINHAAGIRNYSHSTSISVNPLWYLLIKTLNEVHTIGEVWANLLHNVYAVLVAEDRFSNTTHSHTTGTEGNVVYLHLVNDALALHLVNDALALQPCNPTVLMACDPWNLADANHYTGAIKCLLWKVFASKGLGVNVVNHNDDLTVPFGC